MLPAQASRYPSTKQQTRASQRPNCCSVGGAADVVFLAARALWLRAARGRVLDQELDELFEFTPGVLWP